MNKPHYSGLLIGFLLVFSTITKAQRSVSDSSIFMSLAHFSYTAQLPAGDMADRFGMNSAVGGGVLFKTSSNWIFGFDANYLFGSDVKNKDQILKNIETSYGFIIDDSGLPAEVHLRERGFTVFGRVGKLFPVLSPNPNSGLFLIGGLGYIQHKIYIESLDDLASQVRGDYAKGYDKLCGGPAVSEFVGYLYMSNNRLINFYAGFEFTQAWTSSLREYNFAEMKYENENRFDMLNGIKVGWVISIYKREARSYYFD